MHGVRGPTATALTSQDCMPQCAIDVSTGHDPDTDTAGPESPKHKGLRPVKQPPRSAARHLRHAGRHRLSIHASACLPMVFSPVITIASDCRTDSQLAVSKRQPSIRACCAIQSHQGRPRRGWAGRRLSAGGCYSFSSMPSIDRFQDLAVRGFCREPPWRDLIIL